MTQLLILREKTSVRVKKIDDNGGEKMTLQDQTKEYLEKYGIKKKYFAAYLGLYPTQISSWFKGKYTLNNSQIQRVEKFLKGERMNVSSK